MKRGNFEKVAIAFEILLDAIAIKLTEKAAGPVDSSLLGHLEDRIQRAEAAADLLERFVDVIARIDVAKQTLKERGANTP